MEEINASGLRLSNKEALEKVRNDDAKKIPKLRPLWTLKDYSKASSRQKSSIPILKELKKSKRVIKSLNTKLAQKARPIEVLQSWDIEGKGYINKANLKTILNGQGYKVNDTDVEAIMTIANPQNNGKLNTGDVYKMIKKGEGNFDGLNQKDFTNSGGKTIPQMISKAYIHKKEKHEEDLVHTLLSNNVKNINKSLTQHTESGFINPVRAKNILMNTIGKFDTAINTESIVDNILSKNKNSMGVDTFNLIEQIADYRTMAKMEKSKVKKMVRDRFKNDIQIYTSQRLDDTSNPPNKDAATFQTGFLNSSTVKKNDEGWKELAAGKNPIQRVFNRNFQGKDDMVKYLQNMKAGQTEAKDRMSIADIYKLYNNVKQQNTSRLTNADKQDIYKFCQNLQFRDDNRTVSVNDFADLVYQRTQKNDRMKRIDHYPHPIEPLEKQITKTPQLTDKKYNQILSNLNNEINLKRVASFDHFKLFDKDKDGLIKQSDFQNTLKNLNVATKDEASEIFHKFRKDNNKKFLDYSDFHKGLNNPIVPRAFTLPRFNAYRNTRSEREPQSMTQNIKNFAKSKPFCYKHCILTKFQVNF